MATSSLGIAKEERILANGSGLSETPRFRRALTAVLVDMARDASVYRSSLHRSLLEVWIYAPQASMRRMASFAPNRQFGRCTVLGWLCGRCGRPGLRLCILGTDFAEVG